ncbi:MAG: cytochrome P450, partial [Myxococcota bacterium]
MPTSLPDGPPGRIRNTWRIMSDPRQAYCDFQKRYGDMFTVPAMNGTVVVTCTPAGAKAVFSTRSEDTRPFAVEAMRPLVGKDSVLVL